ncbi:glycoside hydrolase family protein [Asaia spathodeae]|uniref:glycoside hydrolase family protein n=1 Tax=Asaia spathodeae TaxID=657016 RepID=UPI002FC3C7BB
MIASLEIALALLRRDDIEGLRLAPYLCPAGYWTIGIGNRFLGDGSPVTAVTKPVTETEALDLAGKTLAGLRQTLLEVVHVSLAPWQEGALRGGGTTAFTLGQSHGEWLPYRAAWPSAPPPYRAFCLSGPPCCGCAGYGLTDRLSFFLQSNMRTHCHDIGLAKPLRVHSSIHSSRDLGRYDNGWDVSRLTLRGNRSILATPCYRIEMVDCLSPGELHRDERETRRECR